MLKFSPSKRNSLTSKGTMKEAFEAQLAHLCELQEIDLNLHKLQEELDSLPEKAKDLLTAFEAVKTELDGVKAELAEVEHAKRTDETELTDSTEHLRNREAKLYAIKTNKEYQAALKEISEGKRLNREREDRILQHMEKIESLTQKITQLNTEFADKESAWGAKRDELAKVETELKRKIEEDGSRRPAIAEKIDKALLRKYDFVRQRYAEAMADASGGVCKRCSTRIPPQLYNEVLKKIDLKVCPSCQRLLFISEAKPEGAAGEGKTS